MSNIQEAIKLLKQFKAGYVHIESTLYAEITNTVASLESEPGNDVICGDHWAGLSGEMIDGNCGCPWCLLKKVQAELNELESEPAVRIDDLKAELKQNKFLIEHGTAALFKTKDKEIKKLQRGIENTCELIRDKGIVSKWKILNWLEQVLKEQ